MPITKSFVVSAVLLLAGAPTLAGQPKAQDASKQLHKHTAFFHGTWDCDGVGMPPNSLVDKSALGGQQDKKPVEVKLHHRFTFVPEDGAIDGTGVGTPIPQVTSMKNGSKSQHHFTYVPGKGLENKHTNDAGVTVDWTSPGWDAHETRQVWTGHASGKLNQNLRSTVTKTSANSFEVHFERQKDGAWVKSGSSKCKLVKRP